MNMFIDSLRSGESSRPFRWPRPERPDGACSQRAEGRRPALRSLRKGAGPHRAPERWRVIKSEGGRAEGLSRSCSRTTMIIIVVREKSTFCVGNSNSTYLRYKLPTWYSTPTKTGYVIGSHIHPESSVIREQKGAISLHECRIISLFGYPTGKTTRRSAGRPSRARPLPRVRVVQLSGCDMSELLTDTRRPT
ncbi:hypothetical protein EVAR_11119_1 [Eumeta japonica]|uniref:Uncharacterized protein n=1 Tax=Eumeta variegata TaxID=151549 RepID=A0A4C1U4A1_EUMVA|nr:hypothetical protein EVAR_11119_1 [Eumeta japonica]